MAFDLSSACKITFEITFEITSMTPRITRHAKSIELMEQSQAG